MVINVHALYIQFISSVLAIYNYIYIYCLVLNVGDDAAVGALAALFTLSFFIIILLLSTLLICTVTYRKLKHKLHSQEATGTAIHNTPTYTTGTVNQYSTYYNSLLNLHQYSTYYAVIDLYLFLSSCSGFPED